MKIKLLLFLSFYYYVSTGQQFKTISPKRESIYSNYNFTYSANSNENYTKSYFAVKIDSIKIENRDTAYYNFNILGHNVPYLNSGCNYPTIPNWTGKKVLIATTGDNLFFNLKGDTLLVKSNAKEGDQWKLYKYSNGDYFEATLASKANGNVLGIADSVKSIVLHLKDASDNIIDHPCNGKEILLSQNYGLVQTINFSMFPSDTSWFRLEGISDAKTGLYDITARDVFDFNVGDEFQIEENTSTVPYNGIFKKEKRIVLSKYVSLNNDTLIYKFKRLVLTENDDWVNNVSTNSTTNDTITEKIIVSNYSDINHVITKLYTPTMVVLDPDRIVWNRLGVSQYNNRIRKSFNITFQLTKDDCPEPIMDSYSIVEYLQGLGYYYNGDQFPSQYHRTLKYYKKGNETWGTPDENLLDVKSIQKNIVSIQPNPFNTNVTFKLGSKKTYEIEILDIFGKQVKKVSFTGTEITIPNEGWKGIHYYRIITSGQVTDTGKIVGY